MAQVADFAPQARLSRRGVEKQSQTVDCRVRHARAAPVSNISRRRSSSAPCPPALLLRRQAGKRQVKPRPDICHRVCGLACGRIWHRSAIVKHISTLANAASDSASDVGPPLGRGGLGRSLRLALDRPLGSRLGCRMVTGLPKKANGRVPGPKTEGRSPAGDCNELGFIPIFFGSLSDIWLPSACQLSGRIGCSEMGPQGRWLLMSLLGVAIGALAGCAATGPLSGDPCWGLYMCTGWH
jgi:hypothetical protein